MRESDTSAVLNVGLNLCIAKFEGTSKHEGSKCGVNLQQYFTSTPDGANSVYPLREIANFALEPIHRIERGQRTLKFVPKCEIGQNFYIRNHVH